MLEYWYIECGQTLSHVVHVIFFVVKYSKRQMSYILMKIL